MFFVLKALNNMGRLLLMKIVLEANPANMETEWLCMTSTAYS
jgi:hypothetical protein